MSQIFSYCTKLFGYYYKLLKSDEITKIHFIISEKAFQSQLRKKSKKHQLNILVTASYLTDGPLTIHRLKKNI